MILNDACAETRFKKILLASDGSEFSEGAVREAVAIAKRHESILHVVSVVEANREYMAYAPDALEKIERKTRWHLDMVRKRAKYEGLSCETRVHLSDDPGLCIVNDAAELESDVIVIGRRGMSGLRRLVIGSVTAQVVGTAPCNVLVVPRQGKSSFASIIAAIDGSRHSAVAAAHAVNIAACSGASLTIVTVVPSDSDILENTSYAGEHRTLIADQQMQAAEQNVRQVKEMAQRRGIAVTGLIFSGSPYEAILQSAAERSADLIVLGSHGKTAFEKAIIGSVAERVVMLAPCSTLVARSPV